MNLKKSFRIFLMSALMLASLIIFGRQPVKADTLSDYVPYTLGASQSGMITENGAERQYYRFTLPSSGQIKFTGSAHMEWVYLYLYDENAQELWRANPHWNSTSEVISISESFYLTSGDYYLAFRRDGERTGSFDFKIDFLSSNESFRETNGGSNNTLTAANEIRADGTSYNGQIAENDRKDFYKFILTESGKINFNAVFYNMRSVYWKLYNKSGEEIWSENPYWNSITESIVIDKDLYMNSGIYYISISESSNGRGMYTFSLPFTPSGETYPEGDEGSNNVISAASPMTLGTAYKGQLAIKDNKDFYGFNLPSSQSVSIQLEADMKYIYIELYDSNGTKIWSKNPYWNTVTQKIHYSDTSVLEKGTYYIAVVQDGSNYGNYVLTVAELTQGNCPHSYDSEWHEATYFDKGYRQYRCKLCGHTYKADYTAVRKLSQGYLYSYYSAGRGSLNLSWSSVYEASGYQIRYSANKSMKSGVVTKKVTNPGTTSKMIKGLSRRKSYYVQVRPYKTNGSKTVYGKWSSKRKMKTQ